MMESRPNPFSTEAKPACSTVRVFVSVPPYSAQEALAELELFLPACAALLPLVPRLKKPARKDWTQASSGDRSIPGFRLGISGEEGIGLLCGEASGGICMVDIDRDCLVGPAEQAAVVLGTAPRVHGARGAKWLVRATGTTRGFALRDNSGRRIGEFLGERQQGVLAGIHPDGKNVYRWHRQGEIPVVNPGDLAESLSVLNCPP